jgi:hypothetical protein
LVGRGLFVTAVVADNFVISMKSEGNAAVGTRYRVTAIGAQEKRSEATPVQEEHGLLTPFDDSGQFILQGPGKGRMLKIDLIRI